MSPLKVYKEKTIQNFMKNFNKKFRKINAEQYLISGQFKLNIFTLVKFKTVDVFF